MEQNWFHIFILFGVSALLISISGCNDPEPHPEATDPVYQSATELKEKTEHELAEARKKRLDLIEEVQKAEPQSGSLLSVRAHLYSQEDQIVNLEQLAKYYEVKQHMRAIEVQNAALERFYVHNDRQPSGDSFIENEQIRKRKDFAWSATKRIELLAPESLPQKSEKKTEKESKAPSKAE